MARSLILLLLVGCASPETDLTIGYDPETKLVTATLHRGWMAGPVAIEGRYKTPDGTEVEFTWMSEVDLDAALADRADTRDAINELAEKAATLAGRAK